MPSASHPFATHLVYLPAPERALFLWGAPPRPPGALAELAARGVDDHAAVLTERGRVEEVPGRRVDLVCGLPPLAAVDMREADRLPPSAAAWSLAAKLVLELAARERLVPHVVQVDDHLEARMVVVLAAPDDAGRISLLARHFPLAAHAVPVDVPPPRSRRRKKPCAVWTPQALLHSFLDDAADALVREAVRAPFSEIAELVQEASARYGDGPLPWEARLARALAGRDARFAPEGFGERSLLGELAAWVEPVLSQGNVPRACFRLELPEAPAGRRRRQDQGFALRFLLQAPDDPSLLVEADEVWTGDRDALQRLGHGFAAAENSLLRGLVGAARMFPPIGRSLREPSPEGVALDAHEAWSFLSEGAAALADGGFGVMLPAELTGPGARRLRLRMRLDAQPRKKTKTAGAVSGVSGLGLEELIVFRWEAALGDQPLSARELATLARHKAPLVQLRGQWVAVDPRELDEIRKRLAEGGGTMRARDALTAALAGTAPAGELPVAVVAEGRLAGVLDRLRRGREENAEPPAGFVGTLRPYQRRGLAWLRTMAGLGLGACLADDMGLGKTVQVLALLLDRDAAAGRAHGPCLLVAPTSVVGNWEREIARFAPALAVQRHYGAERARTREQLESGAPVVLTSYGLLRRDAELLSSLPWSTVVLDEAQNIKNAAAATARAARALEASRRIALTGTPVENRLAELWSILEFLNPGMLGPLERFRRDYAVPVERYGDEQVAERLRRLVGPFVLRRLKSDPAVIQDLPPKNEMKVVCTLSREQATLYQAAVDDAMHAIEDAEGVQRRGMVLALITGLKQICNHPAHYLREPGPLPGRSGKLARLAEMLDEALAAGDRALVFTQYREMGELLVAHLEAALGQEVVFLHGGTARARRDAMVRRFQEDADGPRVFVLSVKAGGTGLNLTAASHVFHYDRWWNPAVEDQATDRAYRIGQQQRVQVHKLLCAGTVEEKVDLMLERKRDLADRIVGAGERWITEMNDEELRALLSLGADVAVDGDEELPAAKVTRARSRQARPAHKRPRRQGQPQGPQDEEPRARASRRTTRRKAK